MNQTYSVREDEGILTVTVERYDDTEGHIVVLIATHPTEGTANGNLSCAWGIIIGICAIKMLILIRESLDSL